MSRYEGNNKAHLRPDDYDKYGDVVADSEDKAVRLIDANALLARVDEEREYLKARGQLGAEHILVHNFRDLIDNAPTVEIPEYYCGYCGADMRGENNVE